MSTNKPYDLKLDWAEQHLVKIESLVSEFVVSRPYEVLPGVKDKNEPARLHFTAEPSCDLPFILGDFLYNVRASLDYMMGAIAPAKKRGRVNFPIFWQGVWEPPVAGEDKQRSEDRRAWQRVGSAGVDPDALAIIKANQPPTAARDGDHHALAVLNKLRNKDTHARLNIVLGRLLAPITYGARNPAAERFSIGLGPPAEGLADGAVIIGIPEAAVEVELTGTVAVMVRPGKDDIGGYNLDGLRPVVLDGVRKMLDWLRPYDRAFQ
jgi:hypothetical protein